MKFDVLYKIENLLKRIKKEFYNVDFWYENENVFFLLSLLILNYWNYIEKKAPSYEKHKKIRKFYKTYEYEFKILNQYIFESSIVYELDLKFLNFVNEKTKIFNPLISDKKREFLKKVVKLNKFEKLKNLNAWKKQNSLLNKYLFSQDKVTLKILGDERGLTRERIRQIIEQEIFMNKRLLKLYILNNEIDFKFKTKWNMILKNIKYPGLKIKYKNQFSKANEKLKIFSKHFIENRYHFENFKISKSEINSFFKDLENNNIDFKNEEMIERNFLTKTSRVKGFINIRKNEFLYEKFFDINLYLKIIKKILAKKILKTTFYYLDDKFAIENGFKCKDTLHSWLRLHTNKNNTLMHFNNQPRIDFVKSNAKHRLLDLIEKQFQWLELYDLKKKLFIKIVMDKNNAQNLMAHNLAAIVKKHSDKIKILN